MNKGGEVKREEEGVKRWRGRKAKRRRGREGEKQSEVHVER